MLTYFCTGKNDVASCSNSLQLPLRRTLVLPVILFNYFYAKRQDRF